nr:metallophosphoesterase [Priestia aryabhattai]MDH3131750.1 metallophosphoesterase [Priestia aryabhattai]
MLGGFMETLKKDWLAFVLISVLICGITLNVRAEEKSGRSGYIEPKLVFPVISDVHIKETGTLDLRTFQHALTQLNEQAPKQDAFVVVGDLADTGALKEYDRFFSVYNQNKQSQAVSLFTIGNHEYRDSVTNQQAQQRFLSKTKMKALYFHQVIKGYHFIMLGTESRLTAGDYSIKQINWLAEQLKIAKRDDPKKPIFVFIHQPINNTLYGKNRWGIEVNEQLLYNTLKPYPQVITFSGHTHHPLDDPRTIFSKRFHLSCNVFCSVYMAWCWIFTR